uniref:Uncharacterized protein n=1 Tax=Solanum lycopersicum TaxID=4081 RepID=A0A494G9M7_SOLLC
MADQSIRISQRNTEGLVCGSAILTREGFLVAASPNPKTGISRQYQIRVRSGIQYLKAFVRVNH